MIFRTCRNLGTPYTHYLKEVRPHRKLFKLYQKIVLKIKKPKSYADPLLRWSLLRDSDDERSALFHYEQAQRFGDKSFYDDNIDERKLVERMLARGEFKRLSGHAWVLEYAPDTLQKLHDEEQLIEQLEKQDSLTARILLADYRFEMALYGMKKYLRCQSTNWCKHPEIAEVLYHALLYAKSATELDPEDRRYWRLLGEITYRLRDDLLYRSMAIEALERVREKTDLMIPPY